MADFFEATAKYAIRHRLGAGGMGVVHLGTMATPAGERKVAIKQLLAEATRSEGVAMDRMIAEARLVFQLTHANICQVLDLAISDQGTFIVMEYVDGCDLRTLLAGHASMVDVAAIVHIGKEIAQALDYAHRRKDDHGRALWLVHGDVTPQNILLSREGEVKLADFGIARALMTGPGNRLLAGTPGFIAPEVREGISDQRADIYGLGMTLYVALSGRSADGGVDLAALRARPDVGHELYRIIERATADRRESRFASAAELAQALSTHQARRFPMFTPSALAKWVQTACEARSQHLDEVDSLVSLTGTATLLAPAQFPEAEDGAVAPASQPSGTRKVENAKSRSKRFATPIVAVSIALLGVGTWMTTRRPLATPPPIARTTPTPPSSPTPPTTTSPPPPPPTTTTTTSTSQKPPPTHLAKVRPAKEMGYITITIEPWGVVYVDGRRFADSTPLYRAPISSGKHRIKVFSAARNAYSPEREVLISPGSTRVLGFEW